MEGLAGIKGVVQSAFERARARGIAAGTWNQAEYEAGLKELKEPVAAGSASTTPARSRKKKINSRRHENFQKMYPDLFPRAGLVLLYDYLWKHSKKTEKGQLRWSGYIKTAAKEIGRGYCTVKRDFKHLEASKVIHRWNTGKPYLGAPAGSAGDGSTQTVVTICWNPADYKRQRIIEKKAAEGKRAPALKISPKEPSQPETEKQPAAYRAPIDRGRAGPALPGERRIRPDPRAAFLKEKKGGVAFDSTPSGRSRGAP